MVWSAGTLFFQKNVCYDSASLFLRIRDPKTARFARRQHGRIDDEFVIKVAFQAFGGLPPAERLFHGSMSTFRKQWNCIMQHLGVPHSQSLHGATPGVLCVSGATYLYSTSEDVNWVAWRGRWSRVRTLEYYLQEVAAYVLMHTLSPQAKERIDLLSRAAWSVWSPGLPCRAVWKERKDLALIFEYDFQQLHWHSLQMSSFSAGLTMKCLWIARLVYH